MSNAQEVTGTKLATWLVWLMVIGLVYCLLLAVGIIGDGFKWVGGGEHGAREIFEFVTNPIMGVLMGMFASALLQSSSTVTAVIVALVSTGMPVSTAIPMVMGANIGTTVTNTLVSMGHIENKTEFRRAFAAATIHDFFNWLSVLVFLPLEMAFGLLEKLSGAMVSWFTWDNSASMSGLNFVSALTKPVIAAIGQKGLLGQWNIGALGGVLMVLIGLALIFFSIHYMGKLLKVLLIGRAKAIFDAAIGRGPITGILSGTIMTVLVQSSSATTSLVIPLAGTGALTLRQVYPFTLGSNIGTCITAVLAATAVTGDSAGPALQIAIVHLLYNVLGVIVIYGIPLLRNIPIVCAEGLADLALKNRFAGVGYMLCSFFVLPGLLMLGSSVLRHAPPDQIAIEGVTEQEADRAEEIAGEVIEVQAPELAIE